METKATLRSVLDRMKEFPDFRFVCSSAEIFQWVEEFALEMLAEIKQRVSNLVKSPRINKLPLQMQLTDLRS